MALYLYAWDRGTTFGADNEFMVAPQIDNLESVYLTLQGFLAATTGENVQVYACFDNEEVGSGTKHGALSTFLSDVLERINSAYHGTKSDLLCALNQSFLVSCDNAHAVHPSHAAVADNNNRVYLNEGIVIKTNANQLYTTDAISMAIFKDILNRAKVPYQVFANRSDQRGGSTLGRLALEHVSIDAIDIGLAQLAMHSAMETAGTKDCRYLVQGIKAFYETNLAKNSENCFVIEA